jgi:hypothetical protein
MFVESLPGYKKNVAPIYNFIPELKMMKKTLSYPEIYTALSRLADPQMVFINMFKENPNNNLISGVVYFPYTPNMLENPNINAEFITKLAKYLELHSSYNFSFENDRIKILKQKLLDLYYLVEDCEDLHAVIPCQNVYSTCKNLASGFCENQLCKNCCESMTEKEYCIIHDDLVNFYRKRMNAILAFEHRKDFDRSRTVRVSLRTRLTKHELKIIFEDGEHGFNIDWDNCEFFFRRGVEKIQYVYLQCKTNEDARKLYEERGRLMKKGEKLEINIQSLMENISEILSRVQNLNEAGLLVVPVSTIVSNNKKLPKKSQRNAQFSEMIQQILKIDSSQFKLTNCNNKINGEFSYDYYLFESTRSAVDELYLSQPFLDCVIFHKLSHLNFFPLLRNKIPLSLTSSLCNSCPNKKSNCLFDLCPNCCSRQFNNLIGKNIQHIKCNCASLTNQSSFSEDSPFKCLSCGVLNPNLFDSKCFNLTSTCEACCKLQIFSLKVCPVHSNLIRNSKYFMSVGNGLSSRDFDFRKFICEYSLNLSEAKLKLISWLRSGDYHWFRKIEETNLTRLMLDMNKELMIIMDNPNFRREGPLRIHDKMYKIFTYQHENILKKEYPLFDKMKFYSTLEGFDYNGDYFLEYDYAGESLDSSSQFFSTFVPSNIERLEVLEARAIENDLDDLVKNLKQSFHLIMYGLDAERFSNYELVEEIYQEMKASLGKFNKEDIVLLDERSVISKSFY